MTRKEITELLQKVIAAYPDTFIKDAKAMVDIWEMNFGNERADIVYKAARLHMTTSKKFPTVSDIRNNIGRVGIYDESRPALGSDHGHKPIYGCIACVYKEDCNRKECAWG